MTPHPNLVICVAGEGSRHAQWIAAAGRRYDVWLVCEPDTDVGDLPDDIRVFDTTPHNPPWAVLHAVLEATEADWTHYGHVFFAADDLDATPEELQQVFDLAAANELQVAQPSLGWRSHFGAAVTLHNPSFGLRYTNRVDTGAMCLEGGLLRELMPLLKADPWGTALGRILPALLPNPVRGAAVIDSVQVLRTRPLPAFSKDAVATGAATAGLLGVPDEAEFSWSGVAIDGATLSLFDGTRDHFLGRLTAGYTAAVQESQVIGDVFIAHLLRSFDGAPRSAASAEPEPAKPQPLPQLRRSPISAAAPQDAKPGTPRRAAMAESRA